MLIVQRNPGESVMIGDIPIVITILGVKGRQVRIGIEAPKEVKVWREEIYRKIKAEQVPA